MEPRRVRVLVQGVVQGVGFRPYVFGLASELGLAGFVRNDGLGVTIEVEGDPAAVEVFLERLPHDAPVLALVEALATQAIAPTGGATFEIVASDGGGARDVLVSPDIATCDACLAEMRDPTNRRFRYPFINCTSCGPRYTIVRDVPYDRPNTTMAPFEMCADCKAEYEDPTDRRFHAQPTCCPACGPTLRVVGAAPDGPIASAALFLDATFERYAAHSSHRTAADDPIARSAAWLRDGKVLAVKGLGGYHLAVDATSDDATGRLRARKHREDKPFAVMVADLDAARGLCEVTDDEAALLTGPARPIVLLPRRPGAQLGAAVAPNNRSLGLMLPYAPLHHLLLEAVGVPLVMTSGNVSDEPIAYLDDDARERLATVADGFLTHDRAIHMRVDDSVVRLLDNRPAVLRRSRGYAPQPLSLAWSTPTHLLAVGAELKSTVCVAKGRRAFLSHHIGDLENYETLRSFEEAIAHLCRLFDVAPRVVAHDLHPEYLSTKHAMGLDGVELVGVQHHHAHIASCLADNGEAGPVIGVAFDGTGYGSDGTIWGGELLVADLCTFQRVGHLAPVPLPGGAAAVREPWRMTAVYLRGDPSGRALAVRERNADRWDAVLAAADAGLNSPLTSSAGRLFDAVAALLGVRDRVHYEGQAAIELEQLADPHERGAYEARIEGQQIHGADLVRAAAADLMRGVPTPAIAMRFHNGVAAAVAAMAGRVRGNTGLDTVALSGGVFQNALLTERLAGLLRRDGFRVLTHSRVPPNDGGICLGQAAVAAALTSSRST